MTSLNISLPESMRAWIDRQVKDGGYGTASEFIRDLIREAKKQRARRELEEKLIKGIESGPVIPVNDEYWKGLRNRVAKRLRTRGPRR